MPQKSPIGGEGVFSGPRSGTLARSSVLWLLICRGNQLSVARRLRAEERSLALIAARLSSRGVFLYRLQLHSRLGRGHLGGCMNWSLAKFDEMEWAQGAHPLEQKKVGPNGMTLLMFEPGFEDPNWCPRSHVVYVLQGTLSFAFETRTIAVAAGQALHIDAETPHRAFVGGGPAALVFIISDVAPVSSSG